MVFGGQNRRAQTRRFTSDGMLLWISDDEGSEAVGMWPGGVAIGSGLIVTGGSENTSDVWDSNARLRVFKLD